MLSTDKISGAFKAIIEEAEKLENKDLPKKVQKRIKSIISIAKHQSDIRNSPKGTCKATKCGHSK
jgi:hypothetical protein